MSQQNQQDFQDALLKLDRFKALQILKDYLTSNTNLECIEHLVVPSMDDMGKGWETGEIALSQLYIGGRICEEIIDEILPATEKILKPHPPMAIMLFRDFHSLGKRVVSTFLKANGYHLLDYGRIDDINELINKLKEDKIEILLISVLMLHSALALSELVEAVKSNGIKLKIIVGGAPFRFDKNLWKEVGADGTAESVWEILDLLNNGAGEFNDTK